MQALAEVKEARNMNGEGDTKHPDVEQALGTTKLAATTKASACILLAFASEKPHDKSWMERQIKAEASAFRKHIGFPK